MCNPTPDQLRDQLLDPMFHSDKDTDLHTLDRLCCSGELPEPWLDAVMQKVMGGAAQTLSMLQGEAEKRGSAKDTALSTLRTELSALRERVKRKVSEALMVWLSDKALPMNHLSPQTVMLEALEQALSPAPIPAEGPECEHEWVASEASPGTQWCAKCDEPRAPKEPSDAPAECEKRKLTLYCTGCYEEWEEGHQCKPAAGKEPADE